MLKRIRNWLSIRKVYKRYHENMRSGEEVRIKESEIHLRYLQAERTKDVLTSNYFRGQLEFIAWLVKK